MTIQSFTDLIAWQKSHQFVLHIYSITNVFPTDEKYGLIDQLRRAGISITSNIAEGFYRPTVQDKKHFYHTAFASLGEIHNQLIIARDLAYLDETVFTLLINEIVEVRKILSGLIKKSQSIKNT